MNRWLILALIGMLPGLVRMQVVVTARFEIDNGSPLIGQPVQLTLIVEAPAGVAVMLPQFPSDWPPFTVQQVGDVRQSSEGDSMVYRQTLGVVPWRTGDFQTPETVVEVQLSGANEKLQVSVQPAYFSVPSVLKPDDLALRPLKPPVSLPYISVWVALAGTAAVLVLVVIFWQRLKKRLLVRPQPVADDLDHLHPAARAALVELKRIAGLHLPVDQFHVLVGDCLRAYVAARFGVSAPEMTTRELLAVLRTDLPQRRQAELERLLERIDLVKFARLQPEASASARLLTVARRWVELVEQPGQETEIVE